MRINKFKLIFAAFIVVPMSIWLAWVFSAPGKLDRNVQPAPIEPMAVTSKSPVTVTINVTESPAISQPAVQPSPSSQTTSTPNLQPGLKNEKVQISAEWVALNAKKTGIGETAIRAYATAEVLLARDKSACNLHWNTLAGIGKIESGHGTIGGRSLYADGRSSTPIFGPTLSGGSFAAVPDTDQGKIDQDPVWDRAVGPMQFIPATWQRYAKDGNGDGVADPHNIFDAAYAAGSYLCATGRDMTKIETWKQSVLNYNHDAEYARSVLEAANNYAELSLR